MFFLRTNGLPLLINGRMLDLAVAVDPQAGPAAPAAYAIAAGAGNGEIRITLTTFGAGGDSTAVGDGLGTVTGHQWRIEGGVFAAIPGATVPGVFTVTAASEHYGQVRNVQVRALGYAGRPGAMVGSIIVIPGAALSLPVNLQLPVIVGTATMNAASTGLWQGNPTPTLAYSWYRNGVLIAGATATTFDASGFSGDEIFMRVTATNSQGAAYADSNEQTVGLVDELIGANSDPLIGAGPTFDNLIGALGA